MNPTPSTRPSIGHALDGLPVSEYPDLRKASRFARSLTPRQQEIRMRGHAHHYGNQIPHNHLGLEVYSGAGDVICQAQDEESAMRIASALNSLGPLEQVARLALIVFEQSEAPDSAQHVELVKSTLALLEGRGAECNAHLEKSQAAQGGDVR